MFEFDTISIIIASSVMAIAIIGALINPFVRGVSTPDEDDNEEDSENKDEKLPPVSVLITAHDNKPELVKNLPAFLTQDYPDYQVVVVFEEGETETEDFLKQTAVQYKNLYFTYSPESSRYMSKKKLQMSLGVKAAKHEWIILTDPTCHPDSDKWLKCMARNCTDSTGVVLGYVHYDEETKGYYHFDRLRDGYYNLRRAQHKAAIGTNMQNIAFRKSEFMKENGFLGSLQFVNGEYDFLVNKYSNDNNTAVELDRNAWLTEDEPTKKTWCNRHIFYYNTRNNLEGNTSMMILRFFDHVIPHLALLITIGAAAYGLMTQKFTIAAAGGVGLLLLFFIRMGVASHAMNKFDEDISAIKLPFYEWSIIFHDFINKIRYWRANKNDFTTHKL